MIRRLLAWCLIPCLSAPALGAKPLFDVDFTVGWGGCYRPMQWTPVNVQLNPTSELKKPLGGLVEISTQQDDLTRMTVRRQFVLTRAGPVRPSIVTKIDFAANTCSLRIAADNGRTLLSREYDQYDARLTAVRDRDVLIGLVGQSSQAVAALAKRSRGERAGRRGRTYIKHRFPRQLPADWTAYASLDLLLLYDADIQKIAPAQAKAIVQWVRNGGRLLVVLGGRPLPADHPLSQALPFRSGDAKKVRLSARALTEWPCGDAPEGLSCWPLQRTKATRVGETFHSRGRDIIFATDWVGFGRVGVLGFDPAALKPGTEAAAARQWVRFLQYLIGRPERNQEPQPRQLILDSPDDDGSGNDYSYEIGAERHVTNSVLGHLLTIRELRPLSIWWVVGLLAALTILLGPVDYLVLKKLDRLPWTWATSAMWVVLFTVGAYFGVKALRAGEMQMRVVSVIDAVQGDDDAWSTTYAGLFAPESDDYQLTGLTADQWWSAIAPTQEELYLGDTSTGSRRIECLQHADGGNRPTAMPINIWSMQCLLREAPVPAVPLSATIKVESMGGYRIEITNRGPVAVQDGYVRFRYGDEVPIGRVEPGATKVFEHLVTNRNDRWGNAASSERSQEPRTDPWGNPIPQPGYDEYDPDRLARPFNSDKAFFALGCAQRTRGMEAYLRAGAAVVCARMDQAPVDFGVQGHTLKLNHIQLVRLVVFPEK